MSGQIECGGCDRIECDPAEDANAVSAWPASVPAGTDIVTERTINDPAVSYITTSLADSILKTIEVAREVVDERSAQDARWGEQNHPDGTSAIGWDWQAENAKFSCEEVRAAGRMTWRHILLEEVFEAFAEEHPDRLRAELLQVAAVAQAWIEAIDRRSYGPSGDLSGSQSDSEKAAA